MSYAGFMRRKQNPVGALSLEVLAKVYRKREEYSPGLDWNSPDPPAPVLPRRAGTGAPVPRTERQGIVNYAPVVRETHTKQRRKRPLFETRSQGDLLQFPRGFVEGNSQGIGDKFPENALHYYCRGCQKATGRPVCPTCGKKV